MYVILQVWNATDAYGINFTSQGNLFISTCWFYIDEANPEVVIGGNSRVLVEATNDQLWIDTKNVRKDNEDPTVFNKTNIKELTALAIYAVGSRVINLLDSYFQYVSAT